MKYIHKNMKTFLCIRGYCLIISKFSEKEFNKIVKDLTIIPKNDKINIQLPKVKNYMEARYKNQKILIIPKFYGLQNIGKPDKVFEYKIEDIVNIGKFNGTLREEQQNIFNKLIDEILVKEGCIIKLATGAGKTVLFLKIIQYLFSKKHFTKKVLIICNQIQLLNQWQNEINNFLPKARVGKIQGKICDFKNKDIVLGMIQTLSIKEIDKNIFKEFDFVCYDECKHVSANVFSTLLFKVCPKYIVGLSATPEREDNLDIISKNHIGNILDFINVQHSNRGPSKEVVKTKELMIYTVQMQCDDYVVHYVNSESTKFIFGKEEVICYSKMISDIISIKNRNKLIINTIKKFANDKNRNLLVLSERRKHLQDIEKLLSKEDQSFTYGLFLGGASTKKDKEQLKESYASKVILATYNAFGEGISKENLNTLIMLTPKKTESILTQVLGRIFRKKHIETNPVIVDFADMFSIFSNSYYQRCRIYRKKFHHAVYKKIKIDLSEDELVFPDYVEDIVEKNIENKNDIIEDCIL